MMKHICSAGIVASFEKPLDELSPTAKPMLTKKRRTQMLQLFWLEERCIKSVESQFHCWFNTKHAFFLAFPILAMAENMLSTASDDDM